MPKTKYPIDLGKTISESLGVPVNLADIPPEKEKEPKHYPGLSLDWDQPYDLPESGEMTVKFKKISETNTKGNDGKTTQHVELELTSIEDVEGKMEEEGEESTGDRLDKAKKKLEQDEKRKRLPKGDDEEIEVVVEDDVPPGGLYGV